MATRQQERDRARRRYEKRQASLVQKESDRARLSRLMAVVGTVLVVVALAAIVGSKLSRTTPSQAADPTAPASTPAVLAAGCTQPPPPLGTSSELTLPDKASAAGMTVTATLTTNCGDIVLTLDGTKAPQAVASFQQLAKADYWLQSPCHRLTTSDQLKVLQCGDPTGSGSGTPGYGFGVENAPANGKYPRGTLAMARTQDPAQGNGGQFFIVWGDSTLIDKAGYTIFGTVTKGLDIVDKIAALGVADGSATPTDGPPNAPISILRVTTTEKKA